VAATNGERQKKIKKISQPNDALLSAKRREKEKKEGIEGKKKKRDLQKTRILPQFPDAFVESYYI